MPTPTPRRWLRAAPLAALLLTIAPAIAHPPGELGPADTDHHHALPPVRTPVATAPATTAPDEAPPAWRTQWDHWYTLEIAGMPAGWMHEALFSDGAQYRSTSIVTIRLNRGGAAIEVRMEDETVETHDGRPVRMRSLQDMARQQVETTWVFRDDHVESIATQGGRTVRTRHDLPEGAWLTPMAVHRYWMARQEAGASEITYRTIAGEGGLTPIAITHTRAGEDEVALDGRMLKATVWETVNSMTPGLKATARYSADGHLLEETTRLPLGAMTARIATRQQAMAAGAAPPPELLVSSFVDVDQPIANARRTSRSVLRLRVREGSMPTLPTAGAQRFEPGVDERTALLHIDVSRPLPASDGERVDSALRRASAMANSDDPLIQAHAQRACTGIGSDPAARAEAMRSYVHRHISSKDLDTAFATASETARLRTGDCSEHGVLLCAMLRSDGIPARVATGLIYADTFAGEHEIFGWHMWTQALIDGAWIDLDATLTDRYDAVHVLTGTSSLADGVAAGEMAGVLLLIGNLEIEVVEVGYE